MKRAVVGVVILVIAAVIAVVLWKRGGSREENPRDALASGGSSSTTATRGSIAGNGAMRVATMPIGFADPGARDRRIAGKVMFAGKPFAGAAVQLTAWGGMIIPPDGERTTGPDGTFDFGARVAGPYEVTASAPSKLAAIVRVPLNDPHAKPAPDALELVLTTCDTWVAGAVRDASGGPIVRARVKRDGVVGTETDDAGAYELCVPAGDLQIEYSADGYGAVVLGVSADLRTRRDVVLVPEAVVQGIVVDEDGKGIGDARVTASPTEWGSERAANRGDMTDAEGRFQITQVLPGRVRLWASTEDMLSDAGQEVVASVGASPDVIMKLARRGRISGVVKRDGKPVAGVPLNAIRRSPVGRSWNTFSQEDGSFVLTRVPLGDVVLSSEQHRVVAPSTLHVEVKPIAGVVVELEGMATIRGRVTRDGAPVAAAEVCCVQRANGQGTRTAADGTYTFEGVMPGTYQLLASTPRAFCDPKPVTVVAAEDHVLDMDLVHGAEIRGTVVDERGKPLRGLHVKFQHPITGDLCRGISDESGRYRCGSMTGGAKYVSTVYPTRAMDVPLPAPADKPYPAIDLKDGKTIVDNVTLTVMHHQGTIRGRVVDTKGSPIADARVRANNEDRFSTWLSLPLVVTDIDGRFELAELADGSYFVQARSTEGGTGNAKAVVGTTPITIAVALPGAVAGTLKGFDGTPVIYVTPLGAYSELNPGTVTGNSYRVSGLKPGRYMINAQTTFEGDARELEIHAGETTTIDLAAKGRGSVDVTITDYATKAPVPNIQCHVVIAVNGMQGLTNWDLATLPRSDATGHLRLEPAPAGNVIVGCVSTDGRRSAPSAEVVLADGANAKVAIQSVQLTVESWGTTGIGFDWRVVPPRIAEIASKSAATESGLAAGDVVTAVDDKPVGTLDGAGVSYLIQNHAIGAKVPISVTRGAQKLRFVVEMRAGS